MRQVALVLAGSVFLAVGWGLPVVAATPGAAPPATTAASASGETGAIKGELEKFMKAVFAGDEQGALDLTYLPDAAATAEGDAFLRTVMADQMWDRALAAAFKDQFKMSDTAVPESQVKELADAKTTVTGETARVEMGNDVLLLVRVKGVWRLDLIKTFATISPMMKTQVAEGAPERKVRAEMIADVGAGKFKTVEEAEAELKRRLAAITPSATDAMPKDPRVLATMLNLSNLKMALEAFEVDTGRYPTTAEGLDALVKRPAEIDAQHWTHSYLANVPVDAWGHAYIYASPGKDDPDFDLSSAGPDGKAGTADDVTKNSR